MADLLLRDTDREILVDEIARAVVDRQKRDVGDHANRNGVELAVSGERLAQLLDVSAATIDRWKSTGAIPSFRQAGVWRYIDADVQDALRETKEGANV